MKISPKFCLSSITLICLILVGCSTENWYEGVKRGGENQCRQATPADADRCISQLNTKSYDEYNKERSGQKQ